MRYNVKELSAEDRSVFDALPPASQSVLLAGGRTDIRFFEEAETEGKFSLAQDYAGNLRLRFHEAGQSPYNAFGLTTEEQYQLHQENVRFIAKEQFGKSFSVFFDKDTGEYISIAQSTLKAPSAINGQPLSTEQQSDFLAGKLVKLGNDSFSLDPTNTYTISGPLQSFSFGKETFQVAATMRPVFGSDTGVENISFRDARNSRDSWETIHERDTSESAFTSAMLDDIESKTGKINQRDSGPGIILNDNARGVLSHLHHTRNMEGLSRYIQDSEFGLQLIDIADAINRSRFFDRDNATAVSGLLEALNSKLAADEYGFEGPKYFTLVAQLDDRSEDLRKHITDQDQEMKTKR